MSILRMKKDSRFTLLTKEKDNTRVNDLLRWILLAWSTEFPQWKSLAQSARLADQSAQPSGPTCHVAKTE